MSKILDAFEDHPIHSQIDNIKSTISTLEDKEEIFNDEQAIEYFERIKQIIRIVEEYLNNIDPLLAPVNILKKIHEQLTQQKGQLENYVNNQNLGHLQNANNNSEAILALLPSLKLMNSTLDIEGLRETIASFRKSAGQYLASLRKEFEEISKAVESLKSEKSTLENEINSQKGRLDKAITDFQSQFSESQSKRSENFDSFLTKSREEADKHISDFEGGYAELLKTLEDESQSIIEANSKEFTEIRDGISKESKDLIETLLGRKTEAEEIVGIIATTGMAGGYQKIARQEFWAYIIFQVIAIGSFAGLITFAIITLSDLQELFKDQKTVNLAILITKSVATLSFGVLGGYAARQAGIHQNNSRANRKMELELTALGPYLSSIPEKEQHFVKKQLAEKLFGNHQSEQSIQVDKNVGSLADAIKMILDSLGELKSKL